MATAEQLKMLIGTYLEKNDDRFRTIVLQLAASEARKGHVKLARDIRTMIDDPKYSAKNNKIIELKREYAHLVDSINSESRLSDMVITEDIYERIFRVINEYKQRNKLLKFGLENRRKVLLTGRPGTGKTLTASVLAGELNLPLNIIQVDKLVTKFMGETSAKLRQIFTLIEESEGVYLFDEFDAIGYKRTTENDVGEMRRVLNSFLQFIENDKSNSIIIAATNNPDLLDKALFRRFDDVINYVEPCNIERELLIKNRIASFRTKNIDILYLVNESKGLSHSEITLACDDAIKHIILSDTELSTDILARMLKHRKYIYK